MKLAVVAVLPPYIATHDSWFQKYKISRVAVSPTYDGTIIVVLLV
jgi:hypothetical protein